MREAAAGGRPAALRTTHAIEIPGKLLAHRTHKRSGILHTEAGMLEEAPLLGICQNVLDKVRAPGKQHGAA